MLFLIFFQILDMFILAYNKNKMKNTTLSEQFQNLLKKTFYKKGKIGTPCI